MESTEVKPVIRPEVAKQRLPLVLEILPGQAGEGLICVYDPGSYEGIPLNELCDKTLSRKNLSIEEQLIVEDIYRQLDGGRLLFRGRDILGTALDCAVLEETQSGEKYWYLPIRAIKPQEGGLPPKRNRGMGNARALGI
jgi:hypothetical protein